MKRAKPTFLDKLIRLTAIVLAIALVLGFWREDLIPGSINTLLFLDWHIPLY